MFCQYLLFFHPFHFQKKEEDAAFPQKYWGCSAIIQARHHRYCFMLVKKVDQVKRWVNLRIWPVSVDDTLSVWKEPYFFFL